MGPDNWVRTIVHCTRHHRDCPAICVKVDRQVPARLRCSPGGGTVGGGGGGGASPDCPCGGRLDISELTRRVNDAMRRGIGDWMRLGAVVIEL